jgi:hypothetical protein
VTATNLEDLCIDEVMEQVGVRREPPCTAG